MKVCILGNARSGTTALYTLMQEIMSENHPDMRYAYEPFLWDRTVFNDIFHNVTEKFSYWDSTSVEGMYQHQKLPLFVEESYVIKNNDYLEEVLETDNPDQNVLSKFIRANGRIRLLNRLCPEMKFIFTIRNPLDSVNSVLTKFSYYGGEFHRDDYPRFINGINTIYNLNYSADQVKTQIERELLYWYYMNRFALETLSGIGADSIIVCHETFNSKAVDTVQRICEFFNYPMDGRYCQTALARVGDLTTKKEISRSELSAVLPYWEKYERLLHDFRVESTPGKEEIFSKYVVTNDDSFRKSEYYGKIPLIPINDSNGLLKANLEKDQQIQEYSATIQRQKDEILEQKIQISELTKILKDFKGN